MSSKKFMIILDASLTKRINSPRSTKNVPETRTSKKFIAKLRVRVTEVLRYIIYIRINLFVLPVYVKII